VNATRFGRNTAKLMPHSKKRANTLEKENLSVQISRSVGLMLLLATMTSALFAQKDVHAALIAPAARSTAPTFHLAGETGKTIQVSDYRGRVVLLNFWATGCGGCVLEIPSLIEIERAYKNEGFTVVGVSVDKSYEELKNDDEAWRKVRAFIVSRKLNYPILMGDDSIVSAYKVNAYPATYLIDKYGRIAATYVGIVDKVNIEENVKALLSER
jgi:peroxiredoxin